MREIADSDLRLNDIPTANADWDVIGEFALTYYGYGTWGSFEACAEIANEQRHGTLAELRTCLFFEQRRWRHYGDEPSADAMQYLRRIVELNSGTRCGDWRIGYVDLGAHPSPRRRNADNPPSG